MSLPSRLKMGLLCSDQGTQYPPCCLAQSPEMDAGFQFLPPSRPLQSQYQCQEVHQAAEHLHEVMAGGQLPWWQLCVPAR